MNQLYYRIDLSNSMVLLLQINDAVCCNIVKDIVENKQVYELIFTRNIYGNIEKWLKTYITEIILKQHKLTIERKGKITKNLFELELENVFTFYENKFANHKQLIYESVPRE